MKKIFIFAAIAAAFMACTKDVDVNTQNPDGNIVRTVTVTASHEGAPEAKATLGGISDNKISFLWEKNDAIKVYKGLTAMSGTPTIAEEDNRSSSATLQISFSETEIPAAGEDMTFLYPAGKGDPTLSEKGASFTFPEEQYAALGGISKDHGYRQLSAAIAHVESAVDLFEGNVPAIEFKNAFAIVTFRFDETLTDVKKVTLSGGNNEVLTGTYDIAKDGIVALDEAKTSYKEAHLIYDSGNTFATTGNYYMVIPPTKFTKGFTVKLTLADGTVLVKSSPSAEFNFARSSVNDLGTFSSGAFAVEKDPEITQLRNILTNSTSMRNIAVDNNYVYIVTSTGSGNVTAYSISDENQTKTLSTKNLATSSQTFNVSDAKVIDNEGTPLLLMCNLAAAGQTLRLYKYSSVDAEAEEVFNFTVPTGTRLGDKFTISGNWTSGTLAFHDFIENNRAYVFTIANGTVDASSCREVAYGSKLGQIGGLYEFGSQRIWAGGKGKTVTVFNESYTQTGTFSMPISGTNVAAIYGLDTFEVRNHEYVSYVQVVDRNKSYLQVYELNEGTNFTAAMTGAVSVASYEYNTEGINTQPCGDVATYSDGSKAYIAVVATGYGITLYSME